MDRKKKRIDLLIQEHYPQLSRTLIQSLIMQGKVKVDGQPITKAGTLIEPAASIIVDLEEPRYVSRAGYKLEKALDHFALDVKEKIALDAGISTGGFTDTLLQRGIKKVYGVDVGYGQVHEKIRKDPRVVIMERTNLKQVMELPDLIDIVTLDLSFISVLKVIDTINRLLKPKGELIVLIKPQFEVEKGQVGRGGIIKDPVLHQSVIEKVTTGIQKSGFNLVGVIESPILGTEGNKEFLAYFIKK